MPLLVNVLLTSAAFFKQQTFLAAVQWSGRFSFHGYNLVTRCYAYFFSPQRQDGDKHGIKTNPGQWQYHLYDMVYSADQTETLRNAEMCVRIRFRLPWNPPLQEL